MKKIIYIVRHGESQSQTGETQEYLNPDLSERGVAQAKRLEPLLRLCKPDLICLSTMQRAWKTYQHAAVSAAKIQFDTRLVECYPPEHYVPRLPIDVPDIAHADVHDAYAWEAPQRINAWWDEHRRSTYKKIMCFCHWNTASHLISAIMGNDLNNKKSYTPVDNASLSVLGLDTNNVPCMLVGNYTEHLNDLLDTHQEALGFLR